MARMRQKTRRAILRGAGESDPRLVAFLRDLGGEDLAPATVRGYTADLAHFARWYEAQVGQRFDVASLTFTDVKSYKAHMVNVDRRRAATVNRRLNAVKRLTRWAAEESVLPEDVGRRVKAVRVTKRGAPRGLEAREIHALLRAAQHSPQSQGHRNYAVLQLILQTGIRLSEAAALEVGDVELRPKSGWLTVRYGKGGKERRLPINSSARDALRDYLETRVHKLPDSPLFLSQRGGLGLSSRGIEGVVSEAAGRARLEAHRVSAHRLRHVFALSYLKDHPGALVRLAALLGHESVDTTAIYTQPSREDLAEDLEKGSLNTFGS